MKFLVGVALALLCPAPLASCALLRSDAGRAENQGIDYDHLRLSVIRIQAVHSDFDWHRPFVPGADAVGLGSGFVVQTEPYPIFVTNAHVINDAKHVSLQLLLYGAEQWEAEVVSTCTKFDLALLVLKQPKTFTSALAGRNITLKSLKLASGAAAMGEDVVALGFPLGQDALKISKGNIAGNEEVTNNICIQSTAPISPGSSGGPLLDSKAEAVVGVNFAKSTVGENINYVIPAWRVSQMVAKHLKDQPEMPADGKWKRIQVKVPLAGFTTIQASPALYELSGGCKHGVFISRVGSRSLFKNATPPVEDNSFLVAVNGKTLDSYGTGLNQDFVADRVYYTDLLYMVEDLSADVEIETCHGGKTTKHTASLAWSPEYERGLRLVKEPNTEGLSTAFEMFGDISIMQMTINHVSQAMEEGNPGLYQWMHPAHIHEPRLVVNYVRPGSYAANAVSAGSAVSKVNGHPVSTLDELRKHFTPDCNGDIWTLETDMGKLAAVVFNQSLHEQVSAAAAMNAPYLLTPGVVSAANARGMELGFGMGDSKDTTQPLHTEKQSKSKAVLLGHGSSSMQPVAAGPLLVQKLNGKGYTTEPLETVHWRLSEEL